MKGIITIIIIIAIAVVAFFILRDDSQPNLSPENSREITDEVSITEDASGVIVETQNTTPVDTTGEIMVVTYNDDGFIPKEISVSAGQTIRFVNESSGNMWVGSAKHPTHIVYSGTSLNDHCPDTDKTAFDQCETSDIYEFTFAKTGEWDYHNHVNPSAFGKVIVE